MVDQFSGYPFCAKLRSTDSTTVTDALRSWFSMFGNPKKIILDNGTQLTSKKFDKFCEERGIRTKPGDTYYPQSNGLSESGVKQVKYLLIKCKEDWKTFEDSLLAYRDTPTSNNYSPFQMFLIRRANTDLPILPGKTGIDTHTGILGAAIRKAKRTEEYAKRSSRDLPELAIGQQVIVQKQIGRKRWTRSGIVRKCRYQGRSYNIEFDDGGKSNINRRHIRPTNDISEDVPEEFHDDPDDSSEDDSLSENSDSSDPDQILDDLNEGILHNQPLQPPPPQPAGAALPQATQQAVRRSNRPPAPKPACTFCPGCSVVQCRCIKNEDHIAVCHCLRSTNDTTNHENGSQTEQGPENRSNPT